jgi:hypothetical protein
LALKEAGRGIQDGLPCRGAADRPSTVLVHLLRIPPEARRDVAYALDV